MAPPLDLCSFARTLMADYVEWAALRGKPLPDAIRTLAAVVWVSPYLGAPLSRVFPDSARQLQGWRRIRGGSRSCQTHGRARPCGGLHGAHVRIVLGGLPLCCWTSLVALHLPSAQLTSCPSKKRSSLCPVTHQRTNCCQFHSPQRPCNCPTARQNTTCAVSKPCR